MAGRVEFERMLPEMFEYLVPVTGFFKKQRSPKMLASYKKMDDIDEVVSDFENAEAFLNDAVRIGEKCIFRKEKYTIFYSADIVKARFRTVGADASDSGSKIELVFRDGSEEILYSTPDTDYERVAKAVFRKLEESGIKTVLV